MRTFRTTCDDEKKISKSEGRLDGPSNATYVRHLYHLKDNQQVFCNEFPRKPPQLVEQLMEMQLY